MHKVRHVLTGLSMALIFAAPSLAPEAGRVHLIWPTADPTPVVAPEAA